MLSLFLCLFLELVCKFQDPQSYGVAALAGLKQDLCCKAHSWLETQIRPSIQPPGKQGPDSSRNPPKLMIRMYQAGSVSLLLKT